MGSLVLIWWRKAKRRTNTVKRATDGPSFEDDAVDAIEKKRRHLESVQKYFSAHKNDLRRISMAWPTPLLKRIDEVVKAAKVSRQAWVFGACEKALAKVEKKTPISPKPHGVKTRTTRKKRRST